MRSIEMLSSSSLSKKIGSLSIHGLVMRILMKAFESVILLKRYTGVLVLKAFECLLGGGISLS